MQLIEIDKSRLQKSEKLGKGNYGTVWKGTWDVTTDVAIKEIEVENEDVNIQQDFLKEVQIMQDLNHPNIARCYGYCIQPPSLVMELLNQSLFEYLKNIQNEIPWEKRIKICLDIVSGLKFIHGRNIIHRDLKSLNVLLDAQLRAKITDFGLARVKSGSSSIRTFKQVGTVR